MNIDRKGQKVPDDENTDINKIAQGDRPKGGRNMADTTAKQHKDKEAMRLVPEKAKRIQGQNESKNTNAKRHMIEKINKIAQGDRPKGGRNMADTTAKQHKDKEAMTLVPEKAKRIQGQNESKNTDAKRHMIEKAKIEALIEKHRLRTPKTPDEVNKSGTGKNAIEKGQEGTSKGKPQYKKATKDIQI